MRSFAHLARAVALRTAIGATAVSSAGYAPQYRDLRGTLPTNGEYPKRDMSKVNGIVIHHTATKGATIRSMAQFHVERRGWQGIGYHYAVGYDGTIFALNDLDRRTNHTAGNNMTTIGIAMIGNLHRSPVPEEQRKSVVSLVQYLKELHEIDNVQPHRAYKATACPGDSAYFVLHKLWTP